MKALAVFAYALFLTALVAAYLIVVLALVGCGDPGGGSADATATYGAEQFHIQLTAIAP